MHGIGQADPSDLTGSPITLPAESGGGVCSSTLQYSPFPRKNSWPQFQRYGRRTRVSVRQLSSRQTFYILLVCRGRIKTHKCVRRLCSGV